MPSKKFWFNVCLSFLQSQMTTTGNCLQRNLNSIWMSLMQVYDALKDGAYHQFKAYVAKKAVIATGDVYKIKLIHEHRFDHDYAMNNLLDDIIDAWQYTYYPTTKKPTWNITAKRFLTEDIISCKVWVKSSSNIILSFTSLPPDPSHSGALINAEETVVFTPDSE